MGLNSSRRFAPHGLSSRAGSTARSTDTAPWRRRSPSRGWPWRSPTAAGWTSTSTSGAITRTRASSSPRRFLEVLGGITMSTPAAGSGRLELAQRLVDPGTNPLTPRVLVNRLWKHHFGEGIVRSTDDFGAMGRKPSHPELLDWLATRVRRRAAGRSRPSSA